MLYCPNFFLECVAGLNDRKGCIFTNDMKLTRQNMKYFVHIVCNEIQVKVNLEITTFFFYLRFPYCPNFFWFGVVKSVLSYGLFTPWLINKLTITLLTSTPERNNILFIIGLRYNCHLPLQFLELFKAGFWLAFYVFRIIFMEKKFWKWFQWYRFSVTLLLKLWCGLTF